jgi:hypothetical protein
MSPLRLLRIAAIAVALPLLFQLSLRVTAASSGGEAVAGREWALGALALLFFLRALATEYSRGPEANFQKDLQWGLAAGGFLAIASRVWW